MPSCGLSGFLVYRIFGIPYVKPCRNLRFSTAFLRSAYACSTVSYFIIYALPAAQGTSRNGTLMSPERKCYESYAIHKGQALCLPEQENICFSYIPQPLRGLRYFFVRHGSVGLLFIFQYVVSFFKISVSAPAQGNIPKDKKAAAGL